MSEINKVKVNGVEYDLPSGSGSGAVSSVNGKTGAVQLAASDVGARPDTWTPTAAQVGAVPSSYQSAINSNTSARHSHSNKTVLDGITASKVAQWDAAGGGSASAAGQNLLDNPWFTVNQRGATTWTSGYGVDRWKVISGSATVTSDGLTVNGTIRQILENAPVGTVTASVLMSSGEATATYDSENNCVDVVSTGGTVRAVKLEYGASSTLSADHEPEYAHELLKCQRFFIRFWSTWMSNNASGMAFGANDVRVLMSIPTQMRSTPSISFQSKTAAGLIGNGQLINLTVSTSVDVVSVGNCFLTIRFSGTSGFTIRQIYCLSYNGYIDISADL